MPSGGPDDAFLSRVWSCARGSLETGPNAGCAGESVMAATAVGRFCGRCGAAISPGVSFCGRCGTPLVAPAVVPAPPPVYSYAPARPGRYPSTGQAKLAGPLVAGGLVLIVLVVAAGLGLLAIS